MTASKSSAARRYLAYAKPYKWSIVLVVLAGVAKFTLPLIPAKIIRIIQDDVVLNRNGLDMHGRMNLLWWLGGVLLVTALLESLAIYFRGVGTVKVGTSIAFDLRQDLFKHLQRLSLGFHHSRPTGTLLSRLMSDIGVSQEMVNGGIINVCIDGVSGSVALVMLMQISWKLTLLVLAVLPFYGLVYRKLNPQIRQASHDVQEQTSVMSGTAIERLAGIAVVQSFAQEPAETEHFAEQADDLRDKSVRRGKLNNLLNAISSLLVSTASAVVLVVGAIMALNERLTVGQMTEFLLVAALLYMPVRRFSEINIVYQNSMAAIERVFAMFDVLPAVQDKPGLPDRTPGIGGLEFDKVQFAYHAEQPVLRGLSFRVNPGEKVAIVGESGAGKSTLVTLIPRLYDVHGGAIRIDGIDVRDYPLRKLRLSIGIVLQDAMLFSGTIAENLRYGRKKAGDAEIVAAAKAANAHEFILQLPDGYETMVGERGVSLSGGQRQRVSLARTILQNPRILILDEATSSLDSESENLITDALHRVMEGRTCLIIAHRLSTVTAADRILAIRQGQLVEDGTHVDLLRKGGYYHHLFNQQFGPLQELIAQVPK